MRATVVNLVNNISVVMAGEPMLDTDQGVLVLQFDDGTNRVYNWDKVIDFYYMTEEEYDHLTTEVED